MISGIGTDIVKIERIAALYKKGGENFVKRILSDSEIERFSEIGIEEKKIAYLAKRFAAKEAIVKAVGTGFGEVVGFADISVLNDDKGKPEVFLSEALKEKFDNLPNIQVSVSDEKEYAVGFAVLELTARGQV